jgi:hypothetical protein
MTSSYRRSVAVAVVVLFRSDLLLVQRKDGETLRPDWEFPYGYLQSAETLDETAQSILLSDAGIMAQAVKRAGILDKPELIGDLVIVYGAFIQPSDVARVSSPSVARLAWAPPRQLPNLAPGHEEIMHFYLRHQH